MEDMQLIELYRARNESAISETQSKYGALCASVAEGILGSREDAEEVANDVWLALWNRIPPDEPESLGAYINRIARNQSVMRLRREGRLKRGGGEAALAIGELEEVLPCSSTTEEEFERNELVRLINAFLETQPKEKRLLFVGRYFYVKSDKELAKQFGISSAGVRMSLMRTRQALKKYLEKEGYII